ncbi:MAG: hypothetical protein CMF42_05290 [Legionellales bacterium]|nr:hypothetical protein [Legionellales bacterium]OUX67095.1 MAG: hypothetical protein CBD38_03635 [bacterium TMED178]|tara:strand:+ start:855 stop:1046 length:192 start_codon:yes stop_codon:yes gene_type:complete
MDWYILFWFIGAVLAAYFIFSLTKSRPDWFSSKSILKTMNTLGFLALGLIGVILLCVMLLKAN